MMTLSNVFHIYLWFTCYFHYRLLITHYPHLCTIEDWLEESLTLQSISQEISPLTRSTTTQEQFNHGRLLLHIQYL